MSVNDDVIDLRGERFVLPAGTHIAWGIFQLQRRKDLWGEDAHIWRPHRWLEGRAIPATNSGAFQAWGAGPRIVGHPVPLRAFARRKLTALSFLVYAGWKCIGQELGKYQFEPLPA